MQCVAPGCQRHAEPLKQVPTCELYPTAAVNTRVLGSKNVFEAVLRVGAAHVVLPGIDEAASQITAMCVSKAMMEKAIVTKARPNATTTTCLARYDKVLESIGPVMPPFRNQARCGQLIMMTDPTITCFI